MNSMSQTKKVTVQGVVNPVPAAIRGEQAGPGASRSNDRNFMLVDNLASLKYNTTSYRTEENPFKRSPLLNRTPPTEGTNRIEDTIIIVDTNEKLDRAPTETELQFESTSDVREQASISMIELNDHRINKTEVIQAISENHLLSPRITYILDMKNSEQIELNKLKATIARMKLATMRQRNISMDIKNGLIEMEETIDVINDYRKMWQSAETALQADKELKQRSSVKAKRKLLPKQSQTVEDNTPTTSKKRSASSPKEHKENKKVKEMVTPGEWKFVQSRKKRKNREKNLEEDVRDQRTENMSNKHGNRTRKPRPETLLIKPNGKSFAEVLREIRTNVNPEDTETEIRSIRKTMKGDILVELSEGTKNKDDFCNALKNIVGQYATVANLEKKALVKIIDIDSFTTKQEVEEAVKKVLKDYNGEFKVNLTKPNFREQMIAFIHIDERGSIELLKQDHIKIGWINCRVRHGTKITRCYKCLSYGHGRSNCQGPDRMSQGICMKCGETGHKKINCVAAPKCVLCLETDNATDHIPGSGGCKVYRKALQKKKNSDYTR